MNQKLQNVRRTLHELIKTLPAVRTHGNAELVRRHLQLIAYFQSQYDALANPEPAFN